MVDFAVHHVFLQAVFRDTIAKLPTRLWLLLEYLAVMAFERKIVGAGESRRSCTHNGDLLTRWGILNKGVGRVEQAGFGSITMHAANSDFFFDQSTPAGLLTRGRTGQTQDIWERQYFLDQPGSLFHRAFSN